ncbi:MAG TPA: hypothetical protein VGK52_10780 [Polyangia bacterium]|jgi:hypothetical protein
MPAHARHAAWTRVESPACTAAHRQALERVQEARLQEAHELFATCARAACSELTRRECTARRTRLESDIPSVVPLVTDGAGQPRVLVEMRIDGRLVTARLDGRAVPIDPGKHQVSFSNDDGVFATRTIVIVQGERNRPIRVVLRALKADGLPTEARATETPPVDESSSSAESSSKAAKETAAPDDDAATSAPSVARQHALDESPAASTTRVVYREGSRSPFAYILGGLGVAGVGGYVLLSTWGRKDNDLIASHCGMTQDCLPASMAHIRKLYLEADISGAAGAVALAAATWLFLRKPVVEERPADNGVSLRSKSKRRVSIQTLDVRASASGAAAMVGGTF